MHIMSLRKDLIEQSTYNKIELKRPVILSHLIYGKITYLYELP